MPNTCVETISLPVVRVQQLRNVVEASGARSLSDAMGKLFAAYAAQGLCQQTFPGVVVNRLSDGIALKIENNERLGLSFEHAREFAAKIREIASLKAKGGYVNIDEDWAIERRGVGFKITAPFSTGTGQTYNADLALELAELLEQAATEPTTA